MRVSRLHLVVVIVALGIYAAYLQLQLYDARSLAKHQREVAFLMGEAAKEGCVTRDTLEVAAKARGWPFRTGEFVEYDEKADHFDDSTFSPNALYVLIDKGVPFSGESETVFLFDEDGCLR